MAENRKTRRQKNKSEVAADVSDFKQLRLDAIKNGEWYSDNVSLLNNFNKASNYGARQYTTSAAVHQELKNALTNNEKIVAASKTLYATNPVYARLIKYFSTLFLWRYIVVPQKLKTDSGIKEEK